MRLVHLYLIVYFALVLGAGFALWRAGILQHAAPLWVGLVAVAALSLGLLLALLSSSPRPVPAE